jgi:hypothetical protein
MARSGTDHDEGARLSVAAAARRGGDDKAGGGAAHAAAACVRGPGATQMFGANFSFDFVVVFLFLDKPRPDFPWGLSGSWRNTTHSSSFISGAF